MISISSLRLSHLSSGTSVNTFLLGGWVDYVAGLDTGLHCTTKTSLEIRCTYVYMFKTMDTRFSCLSDLTYMSHTYIVKLGT